VDFGKSFIFYVTHKKGMKGQKGLLLMQQTFAQKKWDTFEINWARAAERERERMCTSLKGKSSASSIWTTWPILGRFRASGSTHLKATSRERLSAREVGFNSMLGSATSSERLLPTICFNQSTRFICRKNTQFLIIKTWRYAH